MRKNCVTRLIVLVVFSLFLVGCSMAPRRPFYSRIDLKDEVKICYPCYGVNLVKHYKLDGSIKTMEGIHKVIPFVVSKVDLIINGRFRNFGDYKDVNYPFHVFIEDYPLDYRDSTIYLYYKPISFICSHGIWSHDDWPVLDQNEGYFVHADGLPVTKENRTLYRCRDYHIVYPGQLWRNHLVPFSVRKFRKKQRLDGVFFDLAWYHIRYPNRWWYRVLDEDHVVSDNGLIEISDKIIHVSELGYNCVNNIKVCDDSGNDLPIVIYDQHSIKIEAPVGTNVSVSYWAETTIPESIVSSWHQEMLDTLLYVKNSLGNRLVTFNGISENTIEEDDFIDRTNGGMHEGFICPHWSDYKIDKDRWLKQVNDLQSKSCKRIYMAQSGINSNLVSDDEVKRMAMFAFTSYLLGKQSYSYFNFAVSPVAYQTFMYFDYWDVDLGKSRGNFYLSDNGVTYQRRFRRALVVVNPSNSVVSFRVNRGYRAYIDSRGMLHDSVDSFVLSYGEGVILIK